MQRNIFLGAYLIAAAFLAPAGAQDYCRGGCRPHESEGPFLRFLDDLRNFPHGMDTRTPFEERLETERHDFTQSTKTVGKGVFQIESGYSYFYKDEDDEIEHSHAAPETLFRLGVSDDIEFRLRWNYAWRFIDDGEKLDSAQDIIGSIKLGMTEECGLIPESALEIRFSVPTGGSSWSLNRVAPGLDYIYAWELGEGWELYGSTGWASSGLGDFSLLPDEQDVDRFEVWTQSVALGIELTERSVFYSELFGLFSYGAEDNFNIAVYNIGVDYYVSDDFVLDIRVGKGLTKDSDDFFTGIGGGCRF